MFIVLFLTCIYELNEALRLKLQFLYPVIKETDRVHMLELQPLLHFCVILFFANLLCNLFSLVKLGVSLMLNNNNNNKVANKQFRFIAHMHDFQITVTLHQCLQKFCRNGLLYSTVQKAVIQNCRSFSIVLFLFCLNFDGQQNRL